MIKYYINIQIKYHIGGVGGLEGIRVGCVMGGLGLGLGLG